MTLVKLAAGAVLAALIAYSVLGGADFGSGIWSGLARGPRAGRARDALARAIGPVWEANNVWLVAAVVFLFVLFPHGFGDLFTALLVPITVALIALVFRGAAYAFRAYAGESGYGQAGLYGLPYSLASALSPFFFGVALGAAGGGEIEMADGAVTSGLFAPWLRAFPLLFGLTAVAVCAYVAACFMIGHTTGELREEFRARALGAGAALAGLAALTLVVSYWDAGGFWDNWQRPAPLGMAASAVLVGAGSLYVLWRRWWAAVPLAGGAAVAVLVAAWGVTQYPYLLLPAEDVFAAAAGETMLRSSLVGLLAGLVFIVPAVALLYRMFVSEKTDAPGSPSPNA